MTTHHPQHHASDLNTCAHEVCNCPVKADGPFGKFCSQHCQDSKDLAELKCDCGHPGCS